MEPKAPRAVRIGRSRLIQRGMVRRPVVIRLGVVVAVDVLGEVHGRSGAEGVRYLPGIRTVTHVRHHVEPRKRSFLPVPSDEGPAGLVDVDVHAESVRIERRKGGSDALSEIGI